MLSKKTILKRLRNSQLLDCRPFPRRIWKHLDIGDKDLEEESVRGKSSPSLSRGSTLRSTIIAGFFRVPVEAAAINLCGSDIFELRTLKGVHRSRVGSLSWNNNILTTGGMDGKIVNNDVRIRCHAIQRYRGHTQEVCGLKWSGSGQQLASGGNDNLLHIWDLSTSSSLNQSPSQNQWLRRFDDHMAAVKALSWCPFQSNLLASGGGECIKFWNVHTGACLNSVDTGSQVCSLLWNRNERELLSSHGFSQNQLTLWKYQSMFKLAELNGHTSRVLFMAQSPDGCTVASAAGDETLRFWNVFRTPQVAKPAPANPGPFSSYNHIR